LSSTDGGATELGDWLPALARAHDYADGQGARCLGAREVLG